MQEKKTIWHKYFVYDETSPSGLKWKINKGFCKKKGDVAGNEFSTGYYRVQLTIKAVLRTFACHRIVWALHNGKVPEGLVVDHIDGNPLNNKIENLRAVTPTVNKRNIKKQSNNTSGFTGVGIESPRGCMQYFVARWCNSTGRRCAKRFSIAKLGYDKAKTLAIEYRQRMIDEVGGYTERHGK